MCARTLLVVAVLLPRLALADAATEARLRDALRGATAQVRALEDDRAAGKAREEAIQKELDALRSQAKTAPAAKVNPREVADLKRRISELSEGAERRALELAQCQAAAREGADAVRAKEEERVRAATEAALLRDKLAAAETKNERLYRVGKDVLDWLQRQGTGAALAAREPFLGLKRVQLENTAQDYEDKLLEQKTPASTPSSERPSP